MKEIDKKIINTKFGQKNIEDLVYLEKPSYALHGEKDEDGFQIFTPEFIVNGMIEAIGKEEVLNFTKTILEPASGDGAFTGRILEMRLKTIKDDFAIESLKALSTIYSIEMEKSLIDSQRNNIYTIMLNYAKKKKIFNENYFTCLKDIIFSNFIWGMTNTENNLVNITGISVAYPMPSDGNPFEEPVKFYSWSINNDFTYEKKEEEVEL
jgi:hypothetical protein